MEQARETAPYPEDGTPSIIAAGKNIFPTHAVSSHLNHLRV